ncbi:hypothetical protein [Methanolobus sp.]|uniref:hypothetical protein n=1 Tax=Methanolobus sp. TaxID=1874737 RepID=UPI0025D36AF4|nr:hypothetical protein [Methanolobus sp.]
MIITGNAFDESNFNYRDEFVSNGKKAIKQFPILSRILTDFPDFKREHYDSNMFLFLAATSIYDAFCRGPNAISLARLRKYEDLLEELQIDNFKNEPISKRPLYLFPA